MDHPDPIRRAAESIAREVIATPLVTSGELDATTGARVFLKPESLQRTGSFKFRAAYYRLTKLTSDERQRGVVTYSSGNFGKAVAAAGRLLGLAVTIVVPVDAPATKVAGAKALGAKIVVSDHGRENRESAAARLAQRLAADSGAVLLHPFEDTLLLEGHATMVRELVDQVRAAGHALDMIVVPCGGGGLCAGCCIALRDEPVWPRVIAVEPLGFDGLGLSLSAQDRRCAPGDLASICDALQAREPGSLALAAMAGFPVGSATVSDAEVIRALRYGAEVLKLVIEPSAAAPLAALLERKLATAGKTIAVILTGGNIDPSRLAGLLAEEHS